jgi:hypothetical protein
MIQGGVKGLTSLQVMIEASSFLLTTLRAEYLFFCTTALSDIMGVRSKPWTEKTCTQSCMALT